MAEVGLIGPDERLELIEGEIVSMCPQNGPHAITVDAVAETLRKVFGTGWHVREEKPLALELTSEPVPDVAMVAGSRRDYKKDHPTTAVLVVEVSDSTLDDDRSKKASLYAKAGIPEYWIANIPEQRLEVRREPAPMPDQPFGYGYRVVLHVDVTGTISPLAAPEARIPVADLLP
jgi:Uma2 family endonuclease